MKTFKSIYFYRRELFLRNTVLRLALTKKNNILTPPVIRPFPVATGINSSKKKGFIYVKAERNNTFFTFTDLKGKVFVYKSVGCLDFKGKKKRKSRVAILTTLSLLIESIKEKEIGNISLIFFGYFRFRKEVFKIIKKHFFLNFFFDLTKIAHNGCRPKKRRRV